jgi:Rap1a immunity proteins
MTKSALLGAAALALTVTATSAAEEDTGSANYRLRYCKDFMTLISNNPRLVSPFQSGICVGTVAGIAMTGRLIGVLTETETTSEARLACLAIPEAAPLVQQVRVVVAYIDARPARMHERFDLLALEALRTAWPCK